MQKIDKIAIAAVGLILVLGIVLSLTGDDPGKKYTREIEEYAETISDTMGDQSRLRAGDPVAFGEELEALFDLGSGESFPEWAFHRRPTHYSVEKFIPKTPPVHENGGICKVEVLREAPQRLYHRITGVGAGCNEVVEIGRQVVEVAPMGAYGPGDWVEVATIPFSGNGESFTLELDTGLEPGIAYVYRFSSSATSISELTFNDGAEQTLESPMDGTILYPLNEAWECRRAIPTGPGGPGTAAITRHRWDWDKGRVIRDPQPNAVEGNQDGKVFADAPYWVEQIRGDKNPVEVRLRGPERGQRMTLQQGVEPQPLAPKPWEATDGPCFGTAGGEEESGDATSTAGGGGTPDPVVVDDDDDDDDSGGGGLFGDD